MRGSMVVVCILVWVLSLGGAFWAGHERGKQQRPCSECCLEGDICVDKNDWASTSICCVDETGVSAEYSKMLRECEAAQASIKPEDRPMLTKCGLELAECRGALKECQRQ